MDKRLYISILIAVVIAGLSSLSLGYNYDSGQVSGTEITGAQVSQSGSCVIQAGKAVCTLDQREYSSVRVCRSRCTGRPSEEPEPADPVDEADTCPAGGIAVVVGVRTGNRFCGTNGELNLQKLAGSACKEDYECSSNVCMFRECISRPDLLTQFCGSGHVSGGCTCCTGYNKECNGRWGHEICGTILSCASQGERCSASLECCPGRGLVCSGSPKRCVAETSDLGVEIVSSPSYVRAGQSYTIRIRITNEGSATDSFRVILHVVGQGRRFSVDGTNGKYTSLGRDRSSYLSFVWSRVPGITPGDYQFETFVDADGSVPESDENNNDDFADFTLVSASSRCLDPGDSCSYDGQCCGVLECGSVPAGCEDDDYALTHPSECDYRKCCLGEGRTCTSGYDECCGSLECVNRRCAVPVANSPATGRPTISDMTPQVGDTLVIDTSGIRDANGLGTFFRYRWIWYDGNRQFPLPGRSTYRVTSENEGYRLKVGVIFTDGAGYDEAVYSDFTSPVPVASNSPATGRPTINDRTPEVGQTLTAVTSGIDDDDGVGSFRYQWVVFGASESDISGATGKTYKVPSALLGFRLKVRVSFTDDAGYSEGPLVSSYTWTVRAASLQNSPATGAVTVSDRTPQVGDTLAVDTSGIEDDNGVPDDVSDFTYQWIRTRGNSGSNIWGATRSSYEVHAGDLGRGLKVKVTFTDGEGHFEGPFYSEVTSPVAADVNSPATGRPSIRGTAQVGETLTAVTSGIDDDDGVGSFSYQWIRYDSGGPHGGSEIPISGATRSTYRVVSADEYYRLKVRVSFTDDAGYSEGPLVSYATRTIIAATLQNSPASGKPTVSDTTPRVGQTLTAYTSNIEDSNGVGSFSYQWIRTDAYREVNIPGATGRTYAVADSVLGFRLKVRVSFTDDAGNAEAVYSDFTFTVRAAPCGGSGENCCANRACDSGYECTGYGSSATCEVACAGYGDSCSARKPCCPDQGLICDRGVCSGVEDEW